MHLGKSGQGCSVCQRDGVKKIVESEELHLCNGTCHGCFGKEIAFDSLTKIC